VVSNPTSDFGFVHVRKKKRKNRGVGEGVGRFKIFYLINIIFFCMQTHTKYENYNVA
jgi:hypothetical protein